MNYDLPKKVNIVIGCSLDELINGSFNSHRRDYLVQTLKDKNDIVMTIADYFDKDKSISYSVNAGYRFGFRAKRIEIALWFNKTLYLCKVVKNIVKIDQAVLGLDLIANDIIEKEKINSKIVIIYTGNLGDKLKQNIKKIATNKILFLPFSAILKNKAKKYLETGS